jgi:hypothetical protein
MNSFKLSDYRLEVHDVGYFVFLKLISKETSEQTIIETNKEELRDIVEYFSEYLENK